MATIYQVADLAGVSPATVSRVFNGVTVSQEYADRVRQAAADLDFTPNRTARSLRRQSSEVIALIIPDVENPFFTSLARGVEDRAQAAGYSVVLCNTDEQRAKESRYLQVALSENMAGVILAAATDQPDLDDIIDRGTPVVAVDRSTPGYDLDAVLLDNVGGVRRATARLYDRGYRRIGCITGPAGVETAEQRAAGWRSVVRDRDPRPDATDYLRHANYRVDGGQAAMADLLGSDDPPDAVMVTNNLMAVGALRHLTDLGARAPTVGVAVFGELPFGVQVREQISVVTLPSRELGVTAADLLLDRIADGGSATQTVVIDDGL